MALEDELAHAIDQLINWGLHAKRLQEKIANPKPPWEEESQVEITALPASPPAPKGKGKAATPEEVVKRLNEIYPHGWSESGNKRPPGLKKALANLRAAKRKGWSMDVILDGARRMAEAIGKSEDRRFSPALHRWVKDELWLEVPEPVVPKKREKTEEEKRADREQEQQRRKDRLRKQAKLAGVELDDNGNVIRGQRHFGGGDEHTWDPHGHG